MDFKIECPKCAWEPKPDDRWQCSCGHRWNTFETTGRCPNCHKVWEHTQCLSSVGGCGEWSPHLDWYKGLDDALRRAMEELMREKV